MFSESRGSNSSLALSLDSQPNQKSRHNSRHDSISIRPTEDITVEVLSIDDPVDSYSGSQSAREEKTTLADCVYERQTASVGAAEDERMRRLREDSDTVRCSSAPSSQTALQSDSHQEDTEMSLHQTPDLPLPPPVDFTKPPPQSQSPYSVPVTYNPQIFVAPSPLTSPYGYHFYVPPTVQYANPYSVAQGQTYPYNQTYFSNNNQALASELQKQVSAELIGLNLSHE